MRLQKLNQFLARLQKLSEEFNLAVLLTNQVQADPGVSTFLLLTPRADADCSVGRRNVGHRVVSSVILIVARFAAAASAKPIGGELRPTGDGTRGLRVI